MIPYGAIAVGAFWSALAFVLAGFAFKHKALMWVAIPFVVLGSIYTWFSFASVPVELRAMWVRGTLAMVLYTVGPVLTVVSIVTLLTTGRGVK